MDVTKLVAQVVAVIAAVIALFNLPWDINIIQTFLQNKAESLMALYIAWSGFVNLDSVQTLTKKVLGKE